MVRCAARKSLSDQADLLLGFGSSAIGRLPQGYVQNEIALGAYAAKLQSGQLAAARGRALSPEDRFRAELIERVMCDLRVDVCQVAQRHGRPLHDMEAAFPGLKTLQEEKVIRVCGAIVEIEREARPLLRTLAAAFDGYLGRSGRAFSRAV